MPASWALKELYRRRPKRPTSRAIAACGAKRNVSIGRNLSSLDGPIRKVRGRTGSTDDGKLVYAGRVGTGMSQRVLKDLRRRLDSLKRPKSLDCVEKLRLISMRCARKGSGFFACSTPGGVGGQDGLRRIGRPSSATRPVGKCRTVATSDAGSSDLAPFRALLSAWSAELGSLLVCVPS